MTESVSPQKERTSYIIQIDHVSKEFGDVAAVRDVSLQVKQEDIFGLVGSDGAGKSTLLRMAATLIAPSVGTIRINGYDVVTDKTGVKDRIGYMPQRFGLYQDLTVEENMDFFMDIYDITGRERQSRKERYLGFSNLLPFLDRPAGKLSGGMKQKLGLACVLVNEPAVLILDEPTNGVDPVSRQEFWEMLLQMNQEGMTIFVSTAYLDEGEKCDILALMHNGTVLITAPPEEVRQSHATLEAAMIARIQEVDARLLEETFRA